MMSGACHPVQKLVGHAGDLYELALNIGSHPSISRCCERFLTSWVEKSMARHAGVWLRSSLLPHSGDEGDGSRMHESGLVAFCDMPARFSADAALPGTHTLARYRYESGPMCIAAAADAARGLLPPGETPAGTILVMPLGELGLLTTWFPGEEDAVPRSVLEMLKPLMQRFAEAVKAALTRDQLNEEVSGRRRAESDLRQEKQRLQRYLDVTGNITVRVEADGRVARLNPAGAELAEWSPAELAGRDWFETCVPKEWRRECRERFQTVLRGDTGDVTTFECPLLQKSGTRRCVVWRLTLFREAHRDMPSILLSGRDVTEWQEAQRRLEDSERRYRGIVEDLTEMVCRFLPDGTLTFANDAFCRYFNIAPEAVADSSIFDHVAPEDAEDLRAHLEGFDPDRPVQVHENRIVHQEGVARWVMWTNRAFFDEQGRPAMFQATGRDTTELNRTAQRQRTLLHGLRAVVEITDELIGLANARDVCRGAVELARQRLGLERCGLFLRDEDGMHGTFGTDLSGNTTDESRGAFLHNDRWQEKIEELRQGDGRWAYAEHEHYNWRDEHYETAQRGWVVITPILDSGKNVVGVFCNDRAITGEACDPDQQEVVAVFCSLLGDLIERKEAEAELARFAAVVEQASESIMITDLDAVIQYVNPTFEQVTGYSREEVIGHNPRFLQSGQHDQEFYQKLWDTLLAGDPWKGHIIDRRKDGKLFEEEAVFFPVRDERGKVMNYAAVKRDVTREVALENQLRQSQKMQAVGELAGGVAHDFNNLLMVIMNSAQFIQDHLDPMSVVHGDLEEIVRASHRASNLTRQLLAFSRRQALSPRLIDLNQILRGLEKMLTRLLGERVECDIRYSDAPMMVKVDPGQIEQVLVNLAVNARDAMPQGGRLLVQLSTFPRLNTALAVQLVEAVDPSEDPFVAICVSDSGTGMDKETQRQIFEPFFTTKERGRGTGLGLSTAYGIVKQHGGHVAVYSEPGRGSTFKIYLPHVPDATLVSEAEDEVEECRGGEELVLVAEDDDSVRRISVRALESLGYRILEANSGAAALDLARNTREPIDLLMTDLIMPGMDGRELAEVLSEEREEMAILFVSGYPEQHLMDNNLLRHGQAVLQKPFDRTTLGEKVREILDGKLERTAPASG